MANKWGVAQVAPACLNFWNFPTPGFPQPELAARVNQLTPLWITNVPVTGNPGLINAVTLGGSGDYGPVLLYKVPGNPRFPYGWDVLDPS